MCGVCWVCATYDQMGTASEQGMHTIKSNDPLFISQVKIVEKVLASAFWAPESAGILLLRVDVNNASLPLVKRQISPINVLGCSN